MWNVDYFVGKYFSFKHKEDEIIVKVFSIGPRYLRVQINSVMFSILSITAAPFVYLI